MADYKGKTSSYQPPATAAASKEDQGKDNMTWALLPPSLVDSRYQNTLQGSHAKAWALVMAARNIPCQMHRNFWGWSLSVPHEHQEQAILEIRLYERENRNWPPQPESTEPMVDNTLTTLSVLILLAIFHNLTYLEPWQWGLADISWVEAGRADVTKIIKGQWWRTLTALTLHTDSLHLWSNLLLGGPFIVRLCRQLGSGLGLALVLLSGTFGNLLNAYIHPPPHSGIGFSTAVFGAISLLACINAIRNKGFSLKKWAIPLAAALALLALLGTGGERTDLGAHLFGFASGVALGAITGIWLKNHERPGRIINALLIFAVLLTPLAAWWYALAFLG